MFSAFYVDFLSLPQISDYHHLKIKEIIEGDTRFTLRDIARKVGISLSTVHLILKKHLKDFC